MVQRARDWGIATLVDATPFSLGRDVAILREVSRRTGLQIVASTGSYATEDKWLERITEDGLLYLYLKDIQEGMQGFDCKAGVIKCATDAPGFTPGNEKMLRAAARAQRATGLPVLTHCRPPGQEQGLRQQELFAREGADLTKMVIGHFRRGDSLDYAQEVLRRGSYLAIDQMNWQERNLDHNIQVLKVLLDRGWERQLLLSHDAVVCYNYQHWDFPDGGEYLDYAPQMLSYLREAAWDKLLSAGIPQASLERIFFDNPRALFS